MSTDNSHPPSSPQPQPKQPSTVELVIHPKIAPYMLGNIIIIALGVLATVIVLMFADFDGKVVRVISTLLLFAAFTVFAAIDANRDKSARYIQIGQIGHMYMLALNLIMIWGTVLSSGRSSEGIASMGIIMNMLILVGIIKLAVWVVQSISDLIGAPQPGLAFSSLISAVAIATTGILFTLPIGLSDFLEFSEAYWRMSVITVIVAGGAISVTGLLFHLYKEKEPVPTVQRSASTSTPPRYGEDNRQPIARREPEGPSFRVPMPPQNTQQPPQFARQTPPPSPDTQAQDPRRHTSPAGQYAAPVPPQNVPAGPPQFARPVPSVQPWPVYPHGMPLPANEHGRPDFKALQHIAGLYAEAERQWYS